MTGNELIEELKAKYSTEELAWNIPKELIEKYGPVVEVQQFGGEGEGDRWWSIKHFVDKDIYIKINGYYQSHYGTDIYDWSHVQIVSPQMKSITVYE